MKQLLLDIQPPARPSLENFVVGRNAEALHHLLLAAAGSSEARFIYLWGPAGSGKSHLLQACADLARTRATCARHYTAFRFGSLTAPEAREPLTRGTR